MIAWTSFRTDMVLQQNWEGAIRASDRGLYCFMLE